MAKRIRIESKDDRRGRAIKALAKFVKEFHVELLVEEDDEAGGFWICFRDGVTEDVYITSEGAGKLLYLDKGKFHEP